MSVCMFFIDENIVTSRTILNALFHLDRMQFVFLLYHYYHAEEVYNSIRIMITCKFENRLRCYISCLSTFQNSPCSAFQRLRVDDRFWKLFFFLPEE